MLSADQAIIKRTYGPYDYHKYSLEICTVFNSGQENNNDRPASLSSLSDGGHGLGR